MRQLIVSSVLVATCVTPLFAQTPQPRSGQPLNGLDATQLQRFQQGRQRFSRVFTPAEGLGPIFNQTNCASCHNNPIGGPGSITVTRFGFVDSKGTFDPLDALGGSLLQQGAIDPACQESIPPQANVTTLRVTTSVLGAGLVEAIADADIVARELNPPSPNVSGRVHWVHELENPNGPLRAGRYGWKSQLATVLSFSGDAAMMELGLTNRLLPFENAPNGNQALLATWDAVPDPEDAPDAAGFEFIDRVTHFQRFLAAPPQTPKSGMSGEALFVAVGCADCHTPQFTTRNDVALEPALRNKVIKPYSDFLLHDMGLTADFIPDGDAGAQELRTPSLWGVRTRDPLWHDGRIAGGTLETRMLGANGVIDQHAAIGSEAAPSAAQFQALSQAQKLAVVAFLDSLGRAEFDWNGDDVLNRTDLAAFVVARAGGPYTADDREAVFDIDQDGQIGPIDLNAFAQVYGEDCNNNGVNDLLDVLNGQSPDSNQNLIADECEFCQTSLGFAGGGSVTLSICGDDLTTASSDATIWIRQGPPNALALLGLGSVATPTQVLPNEFLVPFDPIVVGYLTNALGETRVPVAGGGNLPITTLIVQAATFDGVVIDLSNALEVRVGSL